MRRRDLLALAGSSVVAAGCLGTAGDDATDGRMSTDTAMSTASPSAPSVTAEVAALQPTVVHLQTDYLTLRGEAGRHLFVDVTVEEGRLPREDVAVVADDERYAPSAEDGGTTPWRSYNGRLGYSPDDGGRLWIRLPATVDAADARLVWPDGERSLPEGVRRRLTAPTPSFSWSFEASETVAVGRSPSVRLSVTNDGDRPGRFVAALSRYGPRVASTPERAFRPLVAPGATATVAVQTDVTGHGVDEAELDDGEGDLRYDLRTPTDSVTRAVRYVADG